MAKIVVAVGGNAILSKDASAEAQMKAVKKTAKELVKFIKNGDQLIITHGNGPQVATYCFSKMLPTVKPTRQCHSTRVVR